MDSKITKKRLSGFMAYEWIVTLIVAVLIMGLWDLYYTIAKVELTPGQQFKVYLDTGVATVSDFFEIADDDVLSYDILRGDYETLSEERNVLLERLSIAEGDIIITDCFKTDENTPSKAERYIINNIEYPMYEFERLLGDSMNYLYGFVLDEYATGDKTVAFDFDKLDKAKIEAGFIARNGTDNRFRKEKERQQGLEKEYARIKKLCSVVKDFHYLIKVYDDQSIFYTFTYENGQSYIYGLRLENLVGGEYKHENYYKMSVAVNENAKGSEDVVVMVFDFVEKQRDLQFETISYLTDMVKKFSNIALPSMA